MKIKLHIIVNVIKQWHWLVTVTCTVQLVMGILYFINPMLLTYSIMISPLAIILGVVAVLIGIKQKNRMTIIMGIIYALPTVILVVLPNPVTGIAIIGYSFFIDRKQKLSR